MSARRSQPHFTFFFLLVIFLLAFGLSLFKISNWDIWWHLKSGEYIWEKGRVPRQDIFSFTAEGRKWVDYEWFFQVVAWKIYSVAALPGLIIPKALLAGITFVLLLIVSLRKGGNRLAALLAVGFALFILRDRLLLRPHIFTLFFLPLYLLILEVAVKRRFWLVFLPPLMVIWANLHGGFVAGFIVLFSYLAAEIANLVFLRFKEGAWPRERPRNLYALAAVTVATLAASLLNPYTYEILLFPFRLVGQKAFMESIFEWMPPLRRPWPKGFYLFWTFLFLTLGAVFFSWRRLKAADLFLLLVFMILAFLARRHIELFLIIAAPILARHLTLNLKRVLGEKALFRGLKKKPLSRLINLTAVLVLLVAAIWVIVSERNAFGVGVRARLYPEKAADFIRKAALPGRMYNEYEWGGYLIWRFFPKQKVFIDGRTVVYGEGIYRDWLKVSEGRENWQEVLDKYGVNFLIINYQKDRPESFWEEKRWVPIYWDDYALVAIRDAPKNRSFIEKYDARLTSPTTFARNFSPHNAQTIITKLQEKIAHDPECAMAHLLLGRSLHRSGNLDAAISQYIRAIEIEARFGGPYYVSGPAYYFLAASRYGQGYIQAAIEDCYKAIRFKPTYCDSYYRLGSIYLELGEKERAKEMLDRAVLCYFRLGLIYLDLGEMEEAKRMLERAARLSPENEMIRAKLHQIGGD